MTTLRVVLLVVLLMVGAPALFSVVAASETGFIPVKLGLSLLSQEQERFLGQKIDHFAQSEAMLNLCGKSTNAEVRMRKAVQDCVDEVSIRTVIARYRQRLAAHRARLKEQFKGLICDNRAIVKIMSKIDASITKDIDEADRTCQSCLFC